MEMQVRVLGNEDLLSKHLHIICCYLKVMACHLHFDSYCIHITQRYMGRAQVRRLDTEVGGDGQLIK